MLERPCGNIGPIQRPQLILLSASTAAQIIIVLAPIASGYGHSLFVGEHLLDERSKMVCKALGAQ